jgi:hypothetical protein
MLAAADTCNAAGHGQEGRRRLFLPSAAALAKVGFALPARTPIERGKLSFGHACNVAMLGGARKRQLLLVLSALLAYVIDCCF